MTSSFPVSDQARSLHLKLANINHKNSLNKILKEVSTGISSDIPKLLGGDTSRINQIEARIRLNETFRRNISEISTRITSIQSSLESINAPVTSMANSFISDAQILSREALTHNAKYAFEALTSTISALNTSVGDVYVFSGTHSNTPALVSPTEFLSHVSNAVQNRGTVEEILAEINAWFDAPAGTTGFIEDAYNGSLGSTTSTAISENQSVRIQITPMSDGLRNILKGLSIASFAAELEPQLTTEQLREMIHAAGITLDYGSSRLTMERSEVGLTEQTLSRTKERNDAERMSFLAMRSDLISVDRYEAAILLNDLDNSMQQIHAVTARLSNLGLLNHLS